MSGPRDAAAAAVGFVAAHQTVDGSIPYWPGGPLDPWDHVECAMALDAGGRHAEAARAYRWLQEAQLSDGSLWSRYIDGERTDRTKDSNLSTYLAVGAWHDFLATCDRAFLRELWPAIVAAIEFALGLQAEHGGIHWARDEHGEAWEDCLVAGSSSVRAALLCAERIAATLDDARGEHWRPRRAALEEAVRERETTFGSSWDDRKERFAMDWYYPALCGVLSGEAAQQRIDGDRERFLVEGDGCRCRDDQPWVTIAESSELALALDRCGRSAQAKQLLEWQLAYQEADGGFRTGTVPDYGPWPDEERPSWTAAAVVLAADAIYGATAASGLFRSLHGD